MIKLNNVTLELALDAVTDLYIGATLRLYRNNYTPLETSVAGDFTEANFSGYVAQALPNFPAANYVGPQAETVLPAQNFIHSGGGVDNDIYGYYVTDAGGDLLFAERNPLGPFSIVPGTSYVVVPYHSIKNQT